MPVPTFSGLPPFPSFEDVTEKLNRLVNEMRNLLLNLDDANFDRITARVIDVEELSAISANLGHITAGLIEAVTIIGGTITGTVINGSTINGGTINVSTDVNIGNFLNMNTSSSAGAKGIVFNNSGGSVAKIDVLSSDLNIQTSGFITLNAGSGAYANGGRIATEGISVGIEVMGGDGTPMTLNFIGGTLRSVT